MANFKNFDFESEANRIDFKPDGELDVDPASLTDEQRVLKAVTVALEYGNYDGSHHKQWALDQVVRILAGDEYDDVIAKFEDGEDGSHTYEWDTGIAP